jgi:hypothetical protein
MPRCGGAQGNEKFTSPQLPNGTGLTQKKSPAGAGLDRDVRGRERKIAIGAGLLGRRS